ncbi:DUF177 domain-containing protein [Corynebacterium sp. sy017]|uniref:YceD family protein n=1 Tax=unclassified Corynebacterium TaxID=2624378 RepID=UPI0011867849|nr:MULTISPECIES: YceD family protein [unclassified Corynebacterium]MBP3087886.1 DUF177 domain-containing protein [Corynebacterium sp. sy017]QDZ42854.1 DUF177 domain-containing protein [Corynebacterium sp. sy039]TSD92427.1 DUF177 domain-containing protein [Corynebacterium sp. SY003]
MKNNKENSPFVFAIGDIIRSGVSEMRRNVGDSPQRIGSAMIGIEQGTEVTIEARIDPLGDAVMVDAKVLAQLQGQCVRCLKELTPNIELNVNVVFALEQGIIGGDLEDFDEEEVPLVIDDSIDLLPTVATEAGLTLPFNPTCEDGCDGSTQVPEPDGLAEQETRTDPRWAGLEKFL